MLESGKIEHLLNFLKEHPRLSTMLGDLATNIKENNNKGLLLNSHNQGCEIAAEYKIIEVKKDVLTFKDEFGLSFFYSYYLAEKYLVAHFHNYEKLFNELSEVYYNERKNTDEETKLVFVMLHNFYGIDIFNFLKLSSNENFWFLYSSLCDVFLILRQPFHFQVTLISPLRLVGQKP